MALAPCTWRTKKQYESNGWIRLGRFLVTAITHIPRRQTFLLEKDLCANYPLIFLPHPEPHTSCTRQLGGWGGQEGLLLCQARTCLLSLLPSDLLPSAWQGEVMQHSWYGFLSGFCSWFRKARAEFNRCISTLKSLILLSLSFSSLGKHTRPFTQLHCIAPARQTAN